MKLTEQDIKWYNEGQSDYSISTVFEWENPINNNTELSIDIIYVEVNMKEMTTIYDFIINPQFGFLDLFNKSDSPWQEYFWEWMYFKGYACKVFPKGKPEGVYEYFHNYSYKWLGIKASPQMLTGYIIEYLESDR